MFLGGTKQRNVLKYVTSIITTVFKRAVQWYNVFYSVVQPSQLTVARSFHHTEQKLSIR